MSIKGLPVGKALVMSEGGLLTSDGRSFFFSAVICVRKSIFHLEKAIRVVPFPFSESQLPGFLTTGRLPFTSGLSFGEVTSSRSSNRLPSGLPSRAFEGAGAVSRC